MVRSTVVGDAILTADALRPRVAPTDRGEQQIDSVDGWVRRLDEVAEESAFSRVMRVSDESDDNPTGCHRSGWARRSR